MGDAPIAYIEGAGGTRVAEDQIVTVGKNDVGEAVVDQAAKLTGNRYCPSKLEDNIQSHASSQYIVNSSKCQQKRLRCDRYFSMLSSG